MKLPRDVFGPDAVKALWRLGFSVTRPQGSRFDVHATSDFETWQPVATVTNINGPVSCFDFEAKDHPRGSTAPRALNRE